jgi:protein-S-isoprenylcysteine O-methyltransferase Ste14
VRAASSYPRDLPPLWLVLAVGVMIGLHFAAPEYVVVPPPWRRAGLVLLAAAVALLAVSARRFRRAGSGNRAWRPAVVLVTDGVYRWSRNPMYLALLTAAIGMAICLGSALPMLVPPLFFLLLDHRFVRREEAFLREHFGVAYEDYCRRVRRWI